MPAAEVKLERIGKRYGDAWVLRGVDLEIRGGDFYTFLGPSGCGKTTLLRIVAGFAYPDEGELYLDGEPVKDLPPWKRGTGMVFQNYALWPHMTVFDNVAFGLRERRIGRAEVRERVAAALAQVGLAGMESRRPSQLSGGQQQRVALARTLVIQPRLLLLDEPLSNLDAKLRQEMRLELNKLQRDLGTTTIYVTHDQEEALALSTRIAVMSGGRIVQEGSPREIYESPQSRFVADFVGKSNFLDATVLRAGDGVLQARTESGETVQAVLREGPPPQRGQRLLLYVRPEAIELCRPGDESGGLNRIAGRVTASAYQGSFIEYEIEAARKVIRAHVANPKRKGLFGRGEPVCALFSPADVGLIRD
jgi:iron(III) transport system ATP-binding protein